MHKGERSNETYNAIHKAYYENLVRQQKIIDGIIVEAKDDGYAFVDGKFVEDKYVWCVLYIQHYYSTYVGEYGCVYDVDIGMNIISDDIYKTLIGHLKKYDSECMNYLYDEFCEYCAGGECAIHHYMDDNFKGIEILDNGFVRYEYKNNGENTGEISNGDGFVVIRYKLSELPEIKNKSWYNCLDTQPWGDDKSYNLTNKIISYVFKHKYFDVNDELPGNLK